MKKNYKFSIKKIGQVWVETAIYTLIGLTLIAIVLSSALPQIEIMKDRETVKQTIVALNMLNQKISDVREAPSSTRIYGLFFSKGKVILDCPNETIYYVIENTRLQFSQVGESIKEGDITTVTEKYGNRYNVILSMNLSKNTNITFNDKEDVKVLQPGPSSYSLKIYNNGTIDSLGRYIVDIKL